jgi:hypothetical protein
MTSRRRHNVKARIIDQRTLRPASGPLSVACPRESCQAQVGHRCRWMVGANWRPLKTAHQERRELAKGKPVDRMVQRILSGEPPVAGPEPQCGCTERRDYDNEKIRTHCADHCPWVLSGQKDRCGGC